MQTPRYFPFFLLLAAGAQAEESPASRYTEIGPASCEAAGEELRRCETVGPWTLLIAGGDDRNWIELKRGDAGFTTYDPIVEQAIGDSPVLAGESVEWRMKGKEDPYGLVFQIAAQEKGAEEGPFMPLIGQFYALSLGEEPGYCGHYTTLAEARQAADSARNCMPLAAASAAAE